MLTGKLAVTYGASDITDTLVFTTCIAAKPNWKIEMSYLKMMQNAAKGAAAGVVLLTALPVFGVVGTLTATGLLVGAVGGAVLGGLEEATNGKR